MSFLTDPRRLLRAMACSTLVYIISLYSVIYPLGCEGNLVDSRPDCLDVAERRAAWRRMVAVMVS